MDPGRGALGLRLRGALSELLVSCTLGGGPRV